jgi:hypothetical protein
VSEPRVLLLGPGANAREFLFMCGLIWGSGTPVAAVIPSNARALDRTRRVGRTFQYPVRVITSEAPRAQLLAGCAAAVWMGPSESGGSSPAVPIASALASGVPVVVPFSVEWAVPEPLRSILVARNSTPNELARVLMRVLGDQRVAASLRQRRTDLERSTEAFVATTLDAYEGKTVGEHQRDTIVRWPAA